MKTSNTANLGIYGSTDRWVRKTMRMLVLLLVPILITPFAAYAIECAHEEAIAAEGVAARLMSWKQVFDAFERFSHCDDGAIAEGFTNSVVRLLATNWQSLPDVPALDEKNPAFRTFVLSHIDETADTADLKRVERLARSQCPKGYSLLCAAIARASTPGRELGILINHAKEHKMHSAGKDYWWKVFERLDNISDKEFEECLTFKEKSFTYQYVLEIGESNKVERVHWERSDRFTTCIDEILAGMEMARPPFTPFYFYLSGI